MEKPRQSFAGLGNISFGFFGIQIGFALQNANMSRVFQSLGASIDGLPALWIAAPLTGLLVQPVIGHLSDRTWLGRFGRRRPYFLGGAVLAAVALLAMPESRSLLAAALLLWMLDASLNISMEPFRAFVGDMLRTDQHTAGYAVQTAFIGAGAVVGSIFPYLLDHFGVSNVAGPGGIPDTVRFSFWAGGVALFAAVLWTTLTTREYAPEELARFGGEEERVVPPTDLAARGFGRAAAWILAGLAVIMAVRHWQLQKEVYLLGALLAAYGLATIAAILLARSGRASNMLAAIVGDFSGMPPLMKRLACVQFFSWSALFIMWIYTTPVVAQDFFGSADPASPAYQRGANWVDMLFMISRAIGKAHTHLVCLLAGAAGFASFLMLRDPRLLIVSEIGIGIAWASILAMPYSILASALPSSKLGIYMGLFNVFVVVPQLLVATVMGSIIKIWFPSQPIWTMAFAAGTLAIAALSMLRLDISGHAPATHVAHRDTVASRGSFG
jgi:maltose/moltooligosaccharide transporter